MYSHHPMPSVIIPAAGMVNPDNGKPMANKAVFAIKITAIKVTINVPSRLEMPVDLSIMKTAFCADTVLNSSISPSVTLQN